MATGLTGAVERIDDIPLLLAQMDKIQLTQRLDEVFPMHGNWQGLHAGDIVKGWLAYILSEGDHRLNHVESWAGGLLLSLEKCLGKPLCALDFSDDRLAVILDCLGQDDKYEEFESKLNQGILRVYDLKVQRVRIDSTSASGYMTVTEDGLFQFGHSKDHHPDLPQLKINQSALDPLGIPLTTTIVSGEKADDPLYIPEICKVQKSVATQGVLYVGDCKMASMATRAYVAKSGDYYLCPLSSIQVSDNEMSLLLEHVWNNQQTLTPVYHPLSDENEKPSLIAEGFVYTVTLQSSGEDEVYSWDEQRLVVHSFKYATKQEKSLQIRLEKAQEAIAKLNKRGQGIKTLDEKELCTAVDNIMKKHAVTGLLHIEYLKNKKETPRQACILVETEITVHATLDSKAWENRVRNLGWRVYACNDKALSLSEAVLAYRQEYLIEHGFARYKGKTLGLTPIYLSSTHRIKGLVRLLGIGLRILCLLEFTVREALLKKEEKLSGIYKGNPKRATPSPTAEMMLGTFRGVSLMVVTLNGSRYITLTPLTAVQVQILTLLDLAVSVYTNLANIP
ncbi:TPA: IS1634 family transposase [Legionella pneumophila subsp. pneumophila]|nr:IS1634 family transposase [Legionella pneumophila subsp. pneumophila]